MKLTWLKFSNGMAMKVLPRVELTPDEQAAGKGKVMVDLSRSKNGGCVFPLEALAMHDGHAPGWAGDGAAPLNSSNPTATAQGYMTRVRDDIAKALEAVDGKVDILVEVQEKTIPDAPPSAYGGDDEAGEANWDQYGIDGAKKDEDEDPEESE